MRRPVSTMNAISAHQRRLTPRAADTNCSISSGVYTVIGFGGFWAGRSPRWGATWVTIPLALAQSAKASSE